MPPSGSGPQQGGGAQGGNPGGMPSGSGSQQGGGPGGSLPAGGDEGGEPGGPNAGWEVSNEGSGPEPGSGQDGEGEGDAGVDSGGVNAGGADEGDDSQVDALARALGELDGEILDERMGTVDAAPGPGSSGGDIQGEGATVPAPPVAEPEIARAPTPIPPDKPDARDDDVVARQLREAAMAETDPKLREQLWEEYRRYKSGL